MQHLARKFMQNTDDIFVDDVIYNFSYKEV